MKKCPQCGTQYSDVTLSFCLQDGTPLVVMPQTDTPTVVLGETETVVPPREAFRVPIQDAGSSSWGHSQATRVAPQALPPEKKGSSTAIAVVLTIVGMLVLFGIVGIGAILFLRNSPGTANVPINNRAIATNAFTPYSTPYSAVSPVTTPQTTPYSTPRPTPVTTPNEPPPPPPLSSYPATKRLVFARGAYSTSFSGDINPGDTRSLVLGCRYGQSLSANVSSGGDCVTIRGGGTSLRTTTNSGDNYITLTNRCSSVAHFNITISVI